MLKDICEKPVPMKEYFSPEARSCLTQFLERDTKKRLGSGPNGTEDIMAHPFFRNINWNDLRDLKIKPPYKPRTAGADDVRQIDAMFTDEQVQETPAENLTGQQAKVAKF